MIDRKKLEQAKEWAETVMYYDDSFNPETLNIAEVIAAVPDTIVDGEKLREVINAQLDSHPHGTVGHQVAEDLACKLQDLLPALPTLAELIKQGKDPADYIFHWVKTEDGIELLTMENDECVYTLDSRGYLFGYDFHEVTPLPDLPRLEWPSTEVQA